MVHAGWLVGWFEFGFLLYRSDQLFPIRVISLLFLTPPIFGVFLLNYSNLPPSMTLIPLFW